MLFVIPGSCTMCLEGFLSIVIITDTQYMKEVLLGLHMLKMVPALQPIANNIGYSYNSSNLKHSLLLKDWYCNYVLHVNSIIWLPVIEPTGIPLSKPSGIVQCGSTGISTTGDSTNTHRETQFPSH